MVQQLLEAQWLEAPKPPVLLSPIPLPTREGGSEERKDRTPSWV